MIMRGIHGLVNYYTCLSNRHVMIEERYKCLEF